MVIFSKCPLLNFKNNILITLTSAGMWKLFTLWQIQVYDTSILFSILFRNSPFLKLDQHSFMKRLVIVCASVWRELNRIKNLLSNVSSYGLGVKVFGRYFHKGWMTKLHRVCCLICLNIICNEKLYEKKTIYKWLKLHFHVKTLSFRFLHGCQSNCFKSQPLSIRNPSPPKDSARWNWRQKSVLVFDAIRKCLANLHWETSQEKSRKAKKVLESFNFC